MLVLAGGDIDVQTQLPIPLFDESRSGDFESFVARFRNVFHRADQSLRFRAYLRGLLEPIARKNVESIAQAASQVIFVETDLAQALQHFVSHSPWDSRRLMSAVRKQTAEVWKDPDAHVVIHEITFPKKGLHSVGVLRQYSRTIGKKINCQLGVIISQIGPKGFFPLAARLYLPTTWIKTNPDTVEKTIPAEFQQSITKQAIALNLLDEILAEHELPKAVIADESYLNSADFVEEIGKRGKYLAGSKTATLETVNTRCDWLKQHLGLDHFEGRTWHGWHHHVVLVFTAYYLLAQVQHATELPPFTTV